MIRALYEKLTGRPWTTTRSMAAEYGPPPGAVYAHQLAKFTDAELILHGRFILDDIRSRACECCRATGTVLHPDWPNDYRIIACPECRPRQHAVDMAPQVSPAIPTHHLMSDQTTGPSAAVTP